MVVDSVAVVVVVAEAATARAAAALPHAAQVATHHGLLDVKPNMQPISKA